MKQIKYNLLHQNFGTIWRDQDLVIPTGISASNITWTKSKDGFPQHWETKMGGNLRYLKMQIGTPPPPPKKKKRHFNKYIGPSQTATTYKKFQRLNLPMGGKGKDHFLLSSQAIFCPRVASWFLIDQSNKWDLKETYTYTF